jgi:hypothetical protein
MRDRAGEISEDVYRLAPRGAPATIPVEHPSDPHATEPFEADYAKRRDAFLDRVRRCAPPEHLAALFHELTRLAAGGPPHLPVFEAALEHVERRRDCADFVLNGILRLLLQFGDDERLPRSLLERARDATLGFKYWPSEPGVDSMCTWTENHQILFHTAAYLAGQAMPDSRFRNSGESGREKCDVARPRILRWLDMRFRTGFSEWLSNVYYDVDLVALLNLIEFCDDAEIRTRATMVVDLILLDMALNSYRGVFGSTHGRSYERSKKWAAQEGMTDTLKLLFGTGSFARLENMSAPSLALGRTYRVPAVLYEIANDRSSTYVHRQRMGIRVAECERWGIGLDDLDGGMELLGLEAYTHPRTIDLFFRMMDRFGWWENAFFSPFRSNQRLVELLRRGRLLPAFARLFERDITRNLREEVNVYTYRTPDYLLSSAQDWRKGYGGDQQHLWQATLGPDAVCFTTHPGPRHFQSPGYWTGSASLPRVAQVRNVVIAIYDARRRPALYVQNRKAFTHAWLPRERFDEVVERGGWILARLGDGYLALRSRQPWSWQEGPGEDRGREIVAAGRRNVWICEMGRRADSGDFPAFVEAVTSAPVSFGSRSVRYESPSQGRLEFGWSGRLRRNGRTVPLDGYARYDNPWVRAEFPADEVTVRHGDHSLRLGWKAGVREASGFLGA